MSKTLRKGDMSRVVSERMGCSIGQGEQALNAVLEGIQDALKNGSVLLII